MVNVILLNGRFVVLISIWVVCMCWVWVNVSGLVLIMVCNSCFSW